MTSTVPTRPGPPRIVGVMAATDHKRLGLLTIGLAFFYFFLGGMLAMLMRAELARPELDVISVETYNQVFTIHGSTMFYLFGSPMAMGLGLYFVPLQVGASQIMWPRIALLGTWLLFGAGLLMYTGFFLHDGAGKAGWFSFDPLSDDAGIPGTGQNLWTLSVIVAGLSGILHAGCILATVIRRRTPGMTMMRIGLFTWGEVVACLMIIAAYPALILAFTLLYIDRTTGLSPYDNPGGPIFYQHLFWFFGHPVVYVVFFPFLGVVAEVIATNSRKKFFGYPFMVGSFLIFAALSVSVWGHHMFTTGAVENRYFSLTSTAIAIVAGIEYFDSMGTMWKGKVVFRTSMLFAIAFFLQFLIGGLSGIFIASPPLDYHVHDTHFIVAHFHYTLMGGTVLGLLAAVYHWFPKVTGRLLDERLGRVHFVLMFIGMLMAFMPLFWLGHWGMVRRIAVYPDNPGWASLNTLASAGAYVILLAMLVFAVNVVRSLRSGPPAGDDPWDGHTLEWATTSPPPRHNFDRVPPVKSYAPLMDLREEAWEREREAEPQG